MCPYQGSLVTQLVLAGSSQVFKLFGDGSGTDLFMCVLYSNIVEPF